MINIVAIAKVPIIEKYGIDEILKPFVEELNQLATVGVTVNIPTGLETFRGTFLGDTQAAHLIGGFKQSVGSAYRMCMASNNTFKLYFNSSSFTYRDTPSHIQHCSNIMTTGPLKDHA